jgi:hypothetical protein
MAEGLAEAILAALLNHKFGSLQNQTDGMVSAVAEIYSRHLYINEMRATIVRWQTHLDVTLKKR